jgi:Flp pilus assembly protein TadB
MLALLIYTLNPMYLRPLWHDKLGNFMVGAAVILQILGAIVIRKIVRIRF